MGSKGEVEGPGAAILVVEDSPTQAGWLRHLLEKWGHTVTAAANGDEALAALSRQRPDLIVSDIVMPVMDGYELCARVKNDPKFLEIPVVLLTALSDPKDVIKALECGADNFITKPYNEEDLAVRLNQLLASRDLPQNESDTSGSRIVFAGQKYVITSGRRQILNLLLSTYEAAVRKNLELLKAQSELRSLNESLDEKVKERTAALRAEVLQRQSAEKEISRLAYYDSLTGLFNGTSMRQQLSRSLIGGGKRVALLLLDLDRFKDINDTLGHDSGDRLLQEAGLRLKSLLPQAGCVARLGEDEFAVVLPGAGIIEAVQAARQILRAFQAPFVVKGLNLAESAGIGIALAPDHGKDVDLLYQRAEVAMYVAKNKQSGYTVYDPAKHQADPTHLVLVGELQQAVDEKQLIAHYQPKVDLRGNRSVGVEALVRWQHPKRGMVPPGVFIPIAERVGMMAALTRRVFDEAMTQYSVWSTYGIHLKVSVNLSANLLHDGEFLAQIVAGLETMNVPTHALMFEITESALMSDPENALRNLKEMSAAGLEFSIDDFGTGYSSLAYMKNLPVQEVKIDRSFIQGMATSDKDAAIVRATIELCHNFGLTVVAEGVEHGEDLQALAALGCDAAQGYHVARPMPGVDLPRWLKESPWPI